MAEEKGPAQENQAFTAPSVSVPRGGGAVRGIGEKFAANPVTGTAATTVPLVTSPGRAGFGPQLALAHDSGSGNGPFGFGWSLAVPAITRKTDKGLPQYRDPSESDVFLLAGAEDLVPVLQPDGTRFQDEATAPEYTIHRYRPRIEGLFARIERWTHRASGAVHWRSLTRDNITTLYGRAADSRIADPDDPRRIFSWLICESYDARGNAMVYEYAAEDAANVDTTQANERNRRRTANRYIKRIKYGNRVSRLLQPDLAQAEWLFEAVFDYGEGHYEELDPDPARPASEQHRLVRASAQPAQPWAVRPDPFSTHRAGFEVRTYRRCHRLLLFHRFAELGAAPCLVASTEFAYNDLATGPDTDIEAELTHPGSTRFASFIKAVTQSGYVREDGQGLGGAQTVTYRTSSLPPLEFEYSQATIQDAIRELPADSRENLPVGLDESTYRWVDLDGEGVSGILSEQAGAWLYKPNLGGGRFGPQTVVPARPSLANLSGGRQQLLDLAGDGQLDLVSLSGPTPGFYERTPGLYERTPDAGWEPFRAFAQRPNIDWEEPNLRFVDLNGDGHADVLITEQAVFTWHPSLAAAGFGPARQVRQPLDEEQGPVLVFADGTQSIYLADMCGDGLSDLVRLRNGEVCYWPNLGYGRFGPRVSMDNAPWFDPPDQFSQERVRLADIDGSGVTDLIYLGRDGARLYFNQSGNRWSAPRPLRQFPPIDNLATVTAADLLGNGTACLVWSSPLPGAAGRALRYIDLMGGQKPHLLIRSVNNLGAETRVQYAASTQFYLADKAAGRPWITRIPFPVHVVERVETDDAISGNRFVTRYAYHHGYFDGEEREFRGFGLVEQWDTAEFAALTASGQLPVGSNVEAASHVPPVLTRTWFHTGIYLGREHVSDFFAGLLDAQDTGEYYREPGLTDAQARALLLADTVLPAGLTLAEEREACRALKGAKLRQEVYALDGSAQAAHPYTVTEQNFTIVRLQAQAGNRHAVFFTHAREAINYQYERNPADPRIAHTLTLEVDRFGNVLKSAVVAYGRRQPDPELAPADRAQQTGPLITYTENAVTNAVDTPDAYHTPLPAAARTDELTGYSPTGPAGRFQADDLVQPAGDGLVLRFDGEVAYEASPGAGRQRRRIEHVRTLYRRDDLTGPLPPGALEALALPYESYKLAFTPGLVATAYGGRVTAAMLADAGRYVPSEGGWWIPSGRVFYAPDPATPPQELAAARAHFFLPHRYRNPFHTDLISTETRVSYDPYDLLVQETVDALGNRNTVGERAVDPTQPLVRSGQDYRVLKPALIMDPNRNRTAIAFDALGLVAGTALLGKPEEIPARGDRLDGLAPDLTEAAVAAHRQDPLAQPQALLQRATTRQVHDLWAYYRTRATANPQPAAVYTLARETHDADLAPGAVSRIQHSIAYSDGFGREVQQKLQAEPGPDGPRWVGSGWTVYNNKGKPVRQYEPFFTDSHAFAFDTRSGVSPVLCYDPVDRVVATLHPDAAWEKVVFGPWRQESWDASDTVLVADPAADADVGDFFRRLPAADYLPTWHARRQGGALGPQAAAAAAGAAVHAGTPAVDHFDPLGRTFLSVAHNRFKRSDTPPADPPAEALYPTRIHLDIEGNQRAVSDALERTAVRYDYDLLSHRIHEASMEAGERWSLADVAGKPIRAWDSRGNEYRTAYDPLRRPTHSYRREGAGAEALVGLDVYGETLPDPEADNRRGQVVQRCDQAGVASSEAFDFKGNRLLARRQLAAAYTTTLDWAGAVPLTGPAYTSRTAYDARNRPTELTAPDSSVIRPSYNAANLLNAVAANLRGAQAGGEPVWTPVVVNIDYDARGQRTRIDYGNGASTSYEYDPQTFRLTHLVTARPAAAFPGDCPQPPPAGWPGCQVESLSYEYDPVGNVTHRRDEAQQTVYFANRRVEPQAEFTYDALYRLIEATGREHLGQAGQPLAADAWDSLRTRLDHPGDGNAMGTYRERYLYDAVGNLLAMQHRGTDPAQPGWTRTYAYGEASQLEAGRVNNRLSSTTLGGAVESYSYAGPDGLHGNITAMPHLPLMRWDDQDRLRATAQQVVVGGGTPETTWYVYDAGGQRVRVVTERQAAPGQVPSRRSERIYLGGFEIYREYGGDGQTVALERETLHLMDDKQRIALVETRTRGDDGSPGQLLRYQLGNHLGSASLELDQQAQIVAYEEYTPYGSTAYQAVRSQTEAPRRFRYTGKERDEASGLYYHGARYYAPWLGRWTAADPSGSATGLNRYEYCRDNPVKFVDHDGRDPTPDQVRFRTLFNERRTADAATAHASTLIEAFRDTQISGGSARDRFVSILGLTGSRDPGPSPHFDQYTIREIGTAASATGTGDSGFRRELRDSIQYHRDAAGHDIPMHRLSSDQIGHFLTAAHIGFSITNDENYEANRQRQAAQYRAEHPYLSFIGDLLTANTDSNTQLTYAFLHFQYQKAMIGHEQIADRAFSGWGITSTISAPFMASPEDVQHFFDRRLDLIQVNDSQNGNSYQDLLMTWIGYRFGQNMANGVYSSRAEAARWLEMMLTDRDLSTVPATDPFYRDAQQVQGLLQQFRQIQDRTHPQPAPTGGGSR